MSRENFWSRRKAAVEEEARKDLLVQEAQEAELREAEQAGRPDDEILAELGLPDPDTLSEGDDFKAFLRETVPARIRTRALRRLWISNPVLANVDGLVDYGEDFTDAACVLEKLQTAYQVGKGMTAHVEELARQAEEMDAPDDGAEEAPAQLSETEEPAGPEAPEAAAPVTGPDTTAAAETDIEYDEVPLPPRRMRFSFEPAAAET